MNEKQVAAKVIGLEQDSRSALRSSKPPTRVTVETLAIYEDQKISFVVDEEARNSPKAPKLGDTVYVVFTWEDEE